MKQACAAAYSVLLAKAAWILSGCLRSWNGWTTRDGLLSSRMSSSTSRPEPRSRPSRQRAGAASSCGDCSINETEEIEVGTSERLKVGVIGCGGIAQMMHLPHLRELHDCFEVVGLADINETVLNAVGDYYGIARRFTDYQALLDTGIDAVLILTSGSHAEPVIAAARAGKHVFAEKPLCYTSRELEEISEAVQTSGVRLMVGYMKRYDPAYRYGQRLIRELANLRYVRITVLHPASELYYQHHVFHPPLPPGPVPTTELGQRMIAFFSSGPEARLIEEVLGADALPVQRTALSLM